MSLCSIDKCRFLKASVCVYLTVEREREIKELKERVHQLEEEKKSAQRQSRLALARAVRAEIET